MENVPGDSPSQEFRHSELRSNASIRLIQIHPDLLRGDISCTLQQFETETQTCPDYTALSYVWGDSTPTKTIYVNGQAYRIHHNLWKLLSHIQSTDGTARTWYWTDILCIDQAHHSEKNEQIARMGEIYAQAARVMSWLGNRDKTRDALWVLNNVYDTRYDPRNGFALRVSERLLKACSQIVREPYWRRVWILQEMVLARDCIVACGNVSVNFEDLVDKILRTIDPSVYFYLHRKSGHFQALTDLKTSIQQNKTVNIVDLINKTSSCRATRDQDRIYGLLGLASRLDPGFDPYTLQISQHKTLDDVWWDIIFMVLEKPDISSMRNAIGSLDNVIGEIPPPRKRWELEMTSTIREAHAETVLQVSRAVYSQSTPFSIFHDDLIFGPAQPPIPGLRKSWVTAAKHVYKRALDVPGLQTSLGWSAYAGLRYTSWHDDSDEDSLTLRSHRPLGWFCAAHMPDPLSEIVAKHRITYTHCKWHLRTISPFVCTGAENRETSCDLSSAMLKIEQLGITCLIRPIDSEFEVLFYCDCCHPRTGKKSKRRRRRERLG